MSGVYLCPHCMRLLGDPGLLGDVPPVNRCDCFPIDGQWLYLRVPNLGVVGAVLGRRPSGREPPSTSSEPRTPVATSTRN